MTPHGARRADAFERGAGLILGTAVLVFILWPVAAVLLESVRGQGGLGAYAGLFSGSGRLIANTLLVCVLTTFLAVGFGLSLALFLTRSGCRGKRFVFASLLLTMISPPFVTSLAYIMLFGRRGLLTHHLLGLSLNPYGLHGIVLMEAAGLSSLAALIIAGSLAGADRRLEHAARDLGAGGFTRLVSVTIPQAGPGILAAAVVCAIRSLSDFGTPLIIGGRFPVLASESYLTAIGLGDLPRASAMNALLLVFSLAAFVVYRRSVSGRLGVTARDKGGLAWPPPPLPRALDLALAAVAWLFIAFQLAQYACILWGAFAAAWGADFSLTLKNFAALDESRLGSFGRSLAYSGLAALAASLMGLILAYLIERRRLPAPGFFDLAAALPLAIPGTFFGLGYVLAFNGLPRAVLDSGALIVANCTFRQLPLSIRAGAAALAAVGEDVEKSARDLGATTPRVLRTVILPLLKSAFLVSLVNTFTATMTTIGSIIFLVTPRTKVATVELFEAIKAGDIGIGAVLAGLIVILTLAANLAFSGLLLGRRGLTAGGLELAHVPAPGRA